MKKAIVIIFLIVCLCSFCFFGYKIFEYIKDEKENDEIIEKLTDISIVKLKTEENEIEEPIDVNFEVLKKENKDIVAWIYSENTPINYPIVQTKDNDYYLKRLINGKYNQAGSLFIDYRNNKNFEDYITIIYGHNMKNHTMFGTLTNYKEQSYYNEHKEINLFTENKKYKIELFAGVVTSTEDDLYNYPKTTTLNKKIIDNAKGKSTFKSQVEVTRRR